VLIVFLDSKNNKRFYLLPGKYSAYKCCDEMDNPSSIVSLINEAVGFPFVLDPEVAQHPKPSFQKRN
jgi:hypothetical protein